MSADHEKNPVRVRTGRLGALSVHSRGKTNTGPATTAAWLRFEKEVDPAGILSPEERRRRAEYARRAFMTRIAMRRWGGAA